MNREIRAFLAIAEEGSVTGAANRLHIAQPAVSKTLKRLEAEVGASLFDRSTRGLILTQAGRTFLIHCKRIEAEYRDALESVEAVSQNHLEILRIGAGTMFHLLFLPNVLADLAKEFPKTRIKVEVGQATKIVPMLMSHDLDLALGRLDESDTGSNLEQYPIADVSTGVILSKSLRDRLKLDRIVNAEQLLEYKWVVYQDDPRPVENLQNYFRRNGLSTPEISIITASFATGMQLVATGEYLMAGPMPLAPYYENFGLCVLPTEDPIAVTRSGVWLRKSSHRYPMIKRFVELMRAQTLIS